MMQRFQRSSERRENASHPLPLPDADRSNQTNRKYTDTQFGQGMMERIFHGEHFGILEA